MTARYTVDVEYSVGGYHSHNKTYLGSMDQVKELIADDVRQFESLINFCQERDGDLRQFCPMFANGYPSADFGAEMGEDFDVTILEVVEKTEKVVTEERKFSYKEEQKLCAELGLI